MHTLREWRTHARERGYTRIAELADYLQADELTHVRLVNRWLPALAAGDKARLDDLTAWSYDAVARIQNFYSDDPYSVTDKGGVRFSFLRSGREEDE